MPRWLCQVVDGTVAALELEAPETDAAALYKKLLPLSGMGPFTAANVLQLLGHYERVPADTETARHLKHRHKLSGLSPKTLQEAAQKVGSGMERLADPSSSNRLPCSDRQEFFLKHCEDARRLSRSGCPLGKRRCMRSMRRSNFSCTGTS